MDNDRKEYEEKYGPMREAMKTVTEEEHGRLVELCQRNCWIKRHGLSFYGDPFLELDSPYTFCRFENLDMLKLFMEHGNWSIRQGVLYKTLFFCNQVNGGDEWWTCRYNQKTGEYIPFESVAFMAVIRKGNFEELVNDMLMATIEECMNLKYRGKSCAKEEEL